jgi:hypothetical protein
MSSRAENTKAVETDPGNDLFWRQNLRRIEAEALRDTMLAISGRMNPKMGGRGFFPHLSGEVLAGQSRPGLDWENSSPEEQSRRSLYAYVRRTMMVPMLDTFDYSNTTSPLGERPVTTVAPQALLLLNDEFMREQAEAFAERLDREASGATMPRRLDQSSGVAQQPGPADLDAYIRRGFQLAIGREPTKRERHIARDFIQRQQLAFAALRTRVTFRPDVPTSLSVSYMDKLRPGQFLIGPAAHWNYHHGRWSAAYEGIRTMERDRGPFALCAAASFPNGVIEAKMFLHTAAESAGLLFRASAMNDEARGYEIVLNPREQRVVLRRHAGDVAVLAQVDARVPTAHAIPLKIQATGPRIRVWLGEAANPVIDFDDPKPVLSAGQVGVRTWGAALSIDDLSLQPDGLPSVAVLDNHLAPPEHRAREAFCLLLLNLNEVVYVD